VKEMSTNRRGNGRSVKARWPGRGYLVIKSNEGREVSEEGQIILRLSIAVDSTVSSGPLEEGKKADGSFMMGVMRNLFPDLGKKL